jgi:hypothetical protein
VMVMTGGKTEIYNTLVIIGEGGLPDTTQIRGGRGGGPESVSMEWRITVHCLCPCEHYCAWNGEYFTKEIK